MLTNQYLTTKSIIQDTWYAKFWGSVSHKQNIPSILFLTLQTEFSGSLQIIILSHLLSLLNGKRCYNNDTVYVNSRF